MASSLILAELCFPARPRGFVINGADDVFPTSPRVLGKDDVFSFSPSASLPTAPVPTPVSPARRVNSEGAAAATTTTTTTTATTATTALDVEEESPAAVELAILQEQEERVEVGKAPYEIKVREEYKCKVRGQEMRSQLEGFVRLVGSGESPEQRELEGGGGVDESLNLEVQCPATELSINPTLKHKHERDKNVLRVSFDQHSATGVLPSALIKYKVDGFQIPLCVRCKTQVKGNDSSSSFLLLQVDVALNLQTYAVKRLCVSEVKVSLKGLSSQVLDARGKQSNGVTFSFNPETSVASWLVAGRGHGDSAPLQTFVCRIELYSNSGATACPPNLPTVVALRFPSHLVGKSAFTTDSPLATVSTSSTLEYTFL